MRSERLAGMCLGASLSLAGCAGDSVIADAGDTGSEAADPDETDATETDETTETSETETEESTTSDETGEEFACGQCANPWVHVGDLELTAVELETLAPCLTEVEGDLELHDIDDATSLAALNHLDRVSGNLRVAETMLLDLEPLGCLTEVGESYRVSFNPELVDVHGLEQLTSVDTLYVEFNDALSSVAGLPTAIKSPAQLILAQNPELADLHGFESIESGWTHVRITGNQALTSLDGIEGLFTGVSATSLAIDANSALTSLAALDGLTSIPALRLEALPMIDPLESLGALAGLEVVEEALILRELPWLTDLSDLAALIEIGSLTATHDDGLTSLDGLTNLVQIGEVQLGSNPVLTDFWGLTPAVLNATTIRLWDDPALTGVDELIGAAELGYLQIDNCDGISSLAGLAALESIGNLSVSDNGSLTSLAGLEQLEVVGNLLITGQPLITSFAPLAELDTIGTLYVSAVGIDDLAPLAGVSSLGSLLLSHNEQLVSLAGLDGITSMAGTLQLHDHPALTSLAALGQLTSVGADLLLYTNPGITDLGGLEQLQSVGESLILGGCQGSEFGDYTPIGTPSLTSLAGLDSLVSVGGIAILGNAAMVSLAGAPNLSTVGEQGVEIHDNAVLASELIDAFVADLEIAGEVSICDLDDLDCSWCSGFGPQ